MELVAGHIEKRIIAGAMPARLTQYGRGRSAPRF
jgi:hypothetical protein